MRFYAESDGDKWQKAFYVVDKYADPFSSCARTDCGSMREAISKAKEWNRNAPWPAWDDIQARRDNYQGPIHVPQSQVDESGRNDREFVLEYVSFYSLQTAFWVSGLEVAQLRQRLHTSADR